ncbi:hypothetical protein VAR608DRAFT_4865 [Variovorax sp. HW608]|uniref:phage tail protein n=1 Tax=Variovorax sp. HW608 TaxID=1034889 RepID=UPI00081FF479|nr:phage tail protein [Variovorax sp. HW608]SCK48959.1 hypothetical protein VAR608DRAFT_4865 [Variovorax sp. HW608]
MDREVIDGGVIEIEAREVNDCEIAIELPELTPAPGRVVLPGGERRAVAVVAGMSVREIVEAAVEPQLWPLVEVFNHGRRVEDWDTFRVRPSDALLLLVVPQGGGGSRKGIIGAVLAIAVAVVAPYAAGALASAGVIGGVGTVSYAATMVGITLVGNLLISALVRPPSVNTGNVSTSAAKSYSLTGQSNAARAYGACIVVYGQHRLYPVTATNPRVENLGEESKLTALYDLGLGYVHFDDIRIGDVQISEYQPALMGHWNSLGQDMRLNFSQIGYDQYAIELQQNVPVTLTTKEDSYSAELDISFPLGIGQIAPQFGSIPYWIDMRSQWRRSGSNDAWQAVPIDWYLGAMGRQYQKPPQAQIQFRLNYGDYAATWYDYDPASSPARLRELQATYRAQAARNNPYPNFKPLPDSNYIVVGSWSSEDYFGRYPDILAAGWDPVARNAYDHFMSIGSREGRIMGAAANVYISVPNIGWYDPATSPSTLHQYDMLYASDDPLVGGWQWIQQGMPSQAIGAAPIEFRVTTGAFDGDGYLARYPDVAAAGMDPWTHFTNFGAFEGRNPYDGNADLDVRLIANFLGQYWLRIAFNFPTPGRYDLRIWRTDVVEDGTDSTINVISGGAVTGRVNKAVLSILRSYKAGPVVAPRLRHTWLEMQVRATDKLQGVVQNLSLMGRGVVLVTDGSGSFWYAETRNPAWIALDVLTSEKNPRPVSRDAIDWPSWLHLVSVCDALRSWIVNGQPFTAARFLFDAVIVDFTTIKELVDSILSGCRASLMLMTNGKWGVLVDEEKATPRQLLTPSNSWGFSGLRTFSQIPHCLRVSFINRDTNYQTDTVPVYADGYDGSNATVFEDLDTFGITDYPHAWAYGRYMMAQGIMRSETFTVSMDVENLVAQRGDRIDVAHDVPRMGGTSTRIVDYGWAAGANGGGLVRIAITLAAAPTGYAIRRSADGVVMTGRVLSVDASGHVIEVDDLTNVGADDLIVLGEFSRVTYPYLVQQITPGADLTAELTLVRYDPAVYTADIGALPGWDPGIGIDFQNGTDLRTFNVQASQSLRYVEREPLCDVQLVWTTQGYALHHHTVVLILPSGVREQLGQVAAMSFLWIVDAIRRRRYFDMPLQFEVTPTSEAGFNGIAGYVSITLVPDRTPPGPPAEYGVNVQKETIDLFWQHPADPDIAHYVLRYTPEVDIPSWDASTLLAQVAWPTTKASAGARTGTYMIRTVDTSGNVSTVEMRRTTVATLPDINVIATVNDMLLDPPWTGIHDNTEMGGGGVLETAGAWGSIPQDAIYYFDTLFDLGAVYECRVSSKLKAFGITQGDLMHNWAALSSVVSMVSATSDLWNVWLEMRVSNQASFMSEWPTLSEVDPIGMGSPDSWSAWRWIEVADITGELLQFRIRLQSKNPGVRPVVKWGQVDVDMPDRTDSYPDVIVPPAGIDFLWDPAFRVCEAVAVTIDGSVNPQVAHVSDRSPIGVHIQLLNLNTAAPEAGQVDIMAKGYGRLRPASI